MFSLISRGSCVRGCAAGLLLLAMVPAATAEERKFTVLLAVPRKSMPPSYPSTPLPNPNDIRDHYFDFTKPGVDSFAEYWNEVSYGTVHVTGGVYGWVEVPWPVLPADNATGNNILAVTFSGADGGERFDESRQMYRVNGLRVAGLVDGWWTPGERFADLNENGGYDDGEPFEDFIRVFLDGEWVELVPPPPPPVTDPPTPRGENEATAYIRANYPGNVDAFIARFGNGLYDGPDAWLEEGNTKMVKVDTVRGVSTPEPDWYADWWAAYWTDVHEASGVANPPPVPDPPAWQPGIPEMSPFSLPGAVLGSPGRPFIASLGEWDEKEDAEKLIYPDADGFYDGRAEYSDMPSSQYHARHPSGLGGGGDRRLGEVTSPSNLAIFGQDLGGGDPGSPIARDKLIRAAGPMAYNVHGTNGCDAGNVLTLEYLTWITTNNGPGGVGTLQTERPEILKRDYNLDGLLDQGSCRLPGTENYTQDTCPCSTNDGNPYSEVYPHNRRRLMEDVVEALDGSVDFDDLTMTIGGERFIFGTILLPAGICPPGAAPGGRGLFQLPAPGMDLAIRTMDFPADVAVWFSDFATAIDGVGDAGQSDANGFGKGLLTHEYLHVWEGYPDLYDYDVYSGGYINHPVGIWDIMSGAWVHPAPVLKEQGSQGFSQHAPWLEVTDLTTVLRPFESTTVTLRDYAFNPSGSACFYENPEFPGERFYFWRLTRVTSTEPARINFSKNLPGDGMMIMHTDLGGNDEGIPPQNRLGSHFTYNVIQADGLQQLENGENTGDSGDPWPGDNGVLEWNGDTDPDSRWWNGKPSGLSITNIDELPDYSLVTFAWHPRLVPELQFLRPPGGRIVNGRFMLKYEAFDLYGGSTIEFYADNDDKGYDGVRLAPDVVKSITGLVVQEFPVPLTSLPSDGRIRFYARLVPGVGADSRREPAASTPQASPNNRGRGRIDAEDGSPGQVTVDLTRSKLEGWVVTCVDDGTSGQEQWEVRGTLSGLLSNRAVSGELFSSPEAGIAFRIEWAGQAGSATVSAEEGEFVLEDPAAQFIASEFKDFDIIRIVSGPRPGLYRVASVLSPTRLQLDSDAGSGPAEYRLHSFKAEDAFGPPDRFTFLTTGKTAYSRPVRIVQGKIVPEICAVIRTAFGDEDVNPAHRAPVTVVFDASESRDETGSVNEGLLYAWDFGDGSNSTGRLVEHTYEQAFPDGVTVTLTVTNPSPYDDPADPVPPPPTLTGTATTVLRILPLTDGLAIVAESDPVVVPEGQTAQLRLALSKAPFRDVQVTARVDSGGGAISVGEPATVTFTPANWQSWRDIPLSAGQDDDVADRSVTLVCTAAGVPSLSVTAIEKDDDVPTIVAGTGTTIVPEGSTTELGVRLSHQPEGPVEVTLSLDAGRSHIRLASLLGLLFTPANWAVDQKIQLVAEEDLDAADRQATLTLRAHGLADTVVSVFEADNDEQRFVLEPSAVQVLEGGTAIVRVRLAAEPEQAVTALLERVSGDADLSAASASTLTFTPENWNTDQSLTFAAAEDLDAVNSAATFRLASADVPELAFTVLEQDNDLLGVLAVNSPLSIPEGGTGELRIVLTAQPVASVVISASRYGGDTDIRIQGVAAFTFTPDNWSVPQALALAALEDLDATNHSTTFVFTGPGVADSYAIVTEQDNDVQAIVSDVSRITVPEEGKATVRIRLAAMPDGSYTVTTARAEGDPDLGVQSGATLVFTPANWNAYQSLTISAARDSDRVHGQAVIRSSGPGAVPCDIVAVELDNTPLAVLVDRTSVTVPETGSETFTVRLNAAPDADLSVAIARIEGDTDLAANPVSVTFTTHDWSTPKEISVSAAADADGVNGSATFRCTAPGALYATLHAFELDDDTQQVLLDVSSLLVAEGGESWCRVRLAMQPETEVQVAVAVASGDPDILVSPATLTFGRGNWNTWQSVRFTAVQDADADDGSAVATFSAPGVPDASLEVRERDDDRQAILCANSLVVPEGGSATLTVRLQARPTADLVVTAEVVGGDADLFVDAAEPMVFTAANYLVARILTVRAAEDGDKTDGVSELRLTAAGVPSAGVRLVERDNDPNTAPVAGSVTVNVAHNSSQVIRLTGNDPDGFPAGLTYRLAGEPLHGTVSGFDGANGELTYTPESGYAGADAFAFIVSDGKADSPPAVVSIVVQPAPVTPPGEEEPPPGDDDPEEPDNPGDSGAPIPDDGTDGDSQQDETPTVVPPTCGAGLMSVLSSSMALLFLVRSRRTGPFGCRG